MDSLLNKCGNLFRIIGASNFVLVDRWGVGFRNALDAECSNDVDLEDASCFAGSRCVLRACSGVTSNELAGNVDVVALFEGLRHGGAFPEEGEGEELPVLYGLAVSVVEPILRETSAHEDAPAGVIDRGLVGEVSCEGHLIKNFHSASPRLPDS